MSRKITIKPEEALNKYLELGQGRSLNKLNKILGSNSPAYDTLKRWCSKYNWVELAKQTDFKARETMKEKHSIELSKKTFNEISELQEINKKLLIKINQTLNITNIDKPEHIKALGDLALSVSKQVQVLTGGVSERTELNNIESLTQNELKDYISKLMFDLGLDAEPESKGQGKKPH